MTKLIQKEPQREKQKLSGADVGTILTMAVGSIAGLRWNPPKKMDVSASAWRLTDHLMVHQNNPLCYSQCRIIIFFTLHRLNRIK